MKKKLCSRLETIKTEKNIQVKWIQTNESTRNFIDFSKIEDKMMHIPIYCMHKMHKHKSG